MITEKYSAGRRNFIKASGLASLGLIIGIDAKAKLFTVSGNTAVLSDFEINPFIVIDTRNNITIINPRNDMGQGTLHSVPALIAEELEVALSQVKIIQSDGKSKYGSQTSGGSSSIRTLWAPLRKAGAAAKEMLIKAAANAWGIPENQCYAADAKVFQKNSSASFTYGQLVEAASKLDVPANPILKDRKDFKILGKDLKRLDIPKRVTGKAIYGLDVEVPGMVYASILHSPMIFGKIVSIDDAAALKVPGVLQVVRCERKMIHRDAESVAVIATSWWAANKGRNALMVQWDNGDLEKTLDTDEYFGRCRAATAVAGINFEATGDFDRKFVKAKARLESVYQTPFLSHVPVEPENTTAFVKADGSVEIWAPIQGPGETLPDVAGYLKIPAEKIKIHAVLMGGSFGRKAYIDFVKEACFLSKKLKKPVKVVWTREDDITQGPYRPGMLSHMQGFAEEGKIAGFHHHVIGESILGQVFKGLADDEADSWIGEALGMDNNGYQFSKAFKTTWTNIKTQIPIMWWRAVNASNLSWGQECFMDELAHLAGKDPLAARLDILKDERFRKLLQMLAEKADYHQPAAPGTGRGLAIFRSFGSICGCCITVSKAGQGIKIDKVVAVMDCGMYVDADTVKAQMEGNIIMGISAAIKKGITFKNGRCEQSNYNNYEVMRINEAPQIDTFIMANEEAPGGVGEPGLPPVAPALGNAIFAATGLRVRDLPIDISNLNAEG